MKLFISSLLATLLIGTTATTPASPSFAATEEQDTQSVFLKTNRISSEYEEYAIRSLPEIVGEIPHLGLDTSELDSSCQLGYGHPFIFQEASYIPLLCDSTILALVSISKDHNGLGWSVSRDFGPELHLLSGKTTMSSPANLYSNHGNIFATVNNDEIQLTDYPELEESRVDSPRGNIAIAVNEFSYKSGYTLNTASFTSRAGSSSYLALDRKEQQGQQQWCSAFAGAQILRYRGKGSITAEQIMRYFYPKSKNLANESISNDQLIKFANSKKSYPKRVSRALSDSEVKAQINSLRPIYMGTKGGGDYKKGRHALVLRGYNDTTYSVWNPWNGYYSSISKSSKTLTVAGGSFVWDVSIYNW